MKDRLMPMGIETPPTDAAIQLHFELELFRFQPNWRFLPKVLSPLLSARGVTRTVNELLNRLVGLL